MLLIYIVKQLSVVMTVMERVQCKKLVNDTKLQESNDHLGQWIYQVRGVLGPDEDCQVAL